ncbi:transcriptional regulator, TetR family [Geosporobacter subterraneus DSM 17957]|uniref:Transcriptional regulator, TetR family n=1 Tax=Geosporobacter subterraneus DSM 17957 TaxID=1121919 RepID=A0A1M6I0Y1_9FIRM|nr:TetR/AcrR family transcriptional regulator [Geosporobacter subterraneus]SHJ28050.1 transcriptional regulator, TetR family [Geosporobacter subterraneus DSM 17957]
MNQSELDARNRIIKAAIEILDEVADVDKITVRQVAERANVGVGLINYHFKTKDNLLSIAIGEVMVKMATGFSTPGHYSDMEPVLRLKKMLKELYSFAERHEKLVKFTLTHGILNGDMQTPLLLVPALREIFGNRKDEIQLRIIALQIIMPIQVTSISPSAFHYYSGIDLYNEAQRNNFIDTLIDNLVNQ